jgi:hypothetical protein
MTKFAKFWNKCLLELHWTGARMELKPKSYTSASYAALKARRLCHSDIFGRLLIETVRSSRELGVVDSSITLPQFGFAEQSMISFHMRENIFP